MFVYRNSFESSRYVEFICIYMIIHKLWFLFFMPCYDTSIHHLPTTILQVILKVSHQKSHCVRTDFHVVPKLEIWARRQKIFWASMEITIVTSSWPIIDYWSWLLCTLNFRLLAWITMYFKLSKVETVIKLVNLGILLETGGRQCILSTHLL